MIDAIAGGNDQAFTWRGTASFSGIGQLRYFTSLSDKIIQGEVTGDNVADFQIELDNMPLALGAADLFPDEGSGT